jgi:hypothetical protein
VRLGELAQRVAGRRAKRRRAADEAPREIVPADAGAAGTVPPPPELPADPFDAARERLKARIPPPPADD